MGVESQLSCCIRSCESCGVCVVYLEDGVGVSYRSAMSSVAHNWVRLKSVGSLLIKSTGSGAGSVSLARMKASRACSRRGILLLE